MERKRDFSWLKNWRVLTLCGGCLFAGFLVGMLIFGSPWHLPPAWGDIPTRVTAIATAGLLAGAVVTAVYAIRAFREQSKEVRHQAAMLSIQSEQLDEQRKLNEKQTVVLELQANEFKESREEREREAEQRKKAQAAKVFVKQANSVYIPDDLSEISETFDETDAWTDITRAEAEAEGGWQVAEMTVVNTSGQPVYDPKLRWHRGSTGHGFPNPNP
jgi:uncharacterized membrane protein (DUF485 family)